MLGGGNANPKCYNLLMVKKNPKTKKQLALFGKKFSRTSVIIATVVLAIVGFAVYTATANELDRRKFVQIEETVLELTDRINAEFVNETSQEALCQHRQFKLDNPVLSCSVSIFVDIANDSEFSSLIAFIEMQDDLIRTTYYESTNIAFAGNHYSLTGQPEVDCFIEQRKSGLAFGCLEYARSAYYPIAE